jgi:adenylate kinase
VAPSVYILAGTPGVGKSTVSRALASRMGVWLLELADIVGPRAVEASASALSARAGSMIRRGGRDAVIATHIVFKPRSIPVRAAVVLRRDPYRLLEELAMRGYPEAKVLENVEAELLGIVYWEALSRFGAGRVFQIDTTGRGGEEVVELAYEALTGGWRGEDIDWISRLESEGRLEGLVTRLSTRGRALTHYRES